MHFFFSVLKTLWQAQSKNVLGPLDSNCWKRNLNKNRQFFSGNGQVLQGPILWFVAAINNGFEIFVESHLKYTRLSLRSGYNSRKFLKLSFPHESTISIEPCPCLPSIFINFCWESLESLVKNNSGSFTFLMLVEMESDGKGTYVSCCWNHLSLWCQCNNCGTGFGSF